MGWATLAALEAHRSGDLLGSKARKRRASKHPIYLEILLSFCIFLCDFLVAERCGLAVKRFALKIPTFWEGQRSKIASPRTICLVNCWSRSWSWSSTRVLKLSGRRILPVRRAWCLPMIVVIEYWGTPGVLQRGCGLWITLFFGFCYSSD